MMGFPGKEPICQSRRGRFDPWIGKSPWRRKRQPTPVFSPIKSHGQRSLVGYSPWGGKELDTSSTHTTWGMNQPYLHRFFKSLLAQDTS